ncbi:hypothetical protein C8Q80DRAFT_1124551 [Daedaleopsis nitida]|nr:hypothetical protein C8Q80DRAFT_1124551 [Daedaleopsis nitida]
MTALLLANAQYLGFWLQLFVTGGYIVYLQRCAWILLNRRRDNRLSLWLPGVCVIMFVITMLGLVANSVGAYRAWSVKSDLKPPNPTLVYSDVASTTALIKDGGTVALALISDCIMVRPATRLIKSLGIWSQWTLSRTKFGIDPIAQDIGTSARDFFAVTFAVNLLCAGMICWKIWRVHSQIPTEVARLGGSPTAHVFEVIIQTAALYCAHLLVLVVTDRIGTNVFFVFLPPLPPVTALVFTVLIVRAHRTNESPTSMMTIRFIPPSESMGIDPSARSVSGDLESAATPRDGEQRSDNYHSRDNIHRDIEAGELDTSQRDRNRRSWNRSANIDGAQIQSSGREEDKKALQLQV